MNRIIIDKLIALFYILIGILNISYYFIAYMTYNYFMSLLFIFSGSILIITGVIIFRYGLIRRDIFEKEIYYLNKFKK